jgi:hypothetical protein
MREITDLNEYRNSKNAREGASEPACDDFIDEADQYPLLDLREELGIDFKGFRGFPVGVAVGVLATWAYRKMLE